MPFPFFRQSRQIYMRLLTKGEIKAEHPAVYLQLAFFPIIGIIFSFLTKNVK